MTVRWPDGSVVPNSSDAIAVPSSWPGYQASRTPLTGDSHGIVTAEPVFSTTIVFGLAAATAEIRLSSALPRSMLVRSLPSDSSLLAKTTATLDAAAASGGTVGGAVVVADGDAARRGGGDALQRGDRAAGVHRGAAAAGGQRAGRRVGADHRDRAVRRSRAAARCRCSSAGRCPPRRAGARRSGRRRWWRSRPASRSAALSNRPKPNISVSSRRRPS